MGAAAALVIDRSRGCTCLTMCNIDSSVSTQPRFEMDFALRDLNGVCRCLLPQLWLIVARLQIFNPMFWQAPASDSDFCGYCICFLRWQSEFFFFHKNRLSATTEPFTLLAAVAAAVAFT